MSRAGYSLLAAALLAFPAWAEPSVPTEGTLTFTILRDGDPIGTHRLSFEHQGGRLVVDVRVEIAVRLFSITVYRRSETKRETWRDGVLVAYEARTDDDGDESAVTAEAADGRLVIAGPRGRNTLPLGLLASTYWNARTVEQSRLLDSATGEILRIDVTAVGEEPVETGRDRVMTRRYRVTGDLERELWYDRNGVWAAMRFEAGDGSTITYRRE